MNVIAGKSRVRLAAAGGANPENGFRHFSTLRRIDYWALGFLSVILPIILFRLHFVLLPLSCHDNGAARSRAFRRKVRCKIIVLIVSWIDVHSKVL